MRWTGLPAAVLPCALAAMLCAGARPAGAQGVTVAISPDSSNVGLGAEFDLDLEVTQAGSAFNGFDAIVSFDPSALTLVPATPTSLQEGALLTDACGNAFHRFLAGAGVDTITDVMLCAGTSVTGPGSVYRLHFRAASTDQVTHVRFVPGSVKFYAAGLFVSPVFTSDAVVVVGSPLLGVGPEARDARLRLSVSPNPGRGRVVLAAGYGGTGPARLVLRDVQGRLVHDFGAPARQVAWDGRLDDGAAAPDGIYFATLSAGGRTTTARFTLIR